MAEMYLSSSRRGGSGEVPLLMASQTQPESQPNEMTRPDQEAPYIMWQTKMANSSTYGTCTLEAGGSVPQWMKPRPESRSVQKHQRPLPEPSDLTSSGRRATPCSSMREPD